MASDTIKTVKIEVRAEAKNAVEGLDKVIRAATQLRETLSKGSGAKEMTSSLQSATAKMSSSIDAQISKIASLKAQLSQMSALYKKLGADRAKLDAAEIKKAGELPGSVGYEKASEKVSQLRQQLQATISEVKELFGGAIPNNAQFEEAILRLKYELKDAETALKAMQRAERDQASASNQSASATQNSTNASKKAASSHRSFSTALKKVSSVAKSLKSHLLSAVSGIKSLASSIKGAIPHSNKFGGALGKLLSTFKRLFVMRLLRNMIMNIIKAFKEGTQNIAQYSKAMNGLDANNANKAMSELASTGAYLKNVLGSAVIPVLNALLPIIRSVATGFATAVNYVNQFMSALGGKSSWTRAKSVTVDYASSLSDVGSSAGGAKDAVEDLKRTILGFDEINKLNDAGSSGSGGGSGGGGGGSDTVNYNDMFEEVPIDNKVMQWLQELKPYIDSIKGAWKDVKDAVNELTQSEGFKYLVGTVFRGILNGIALALEGIAYTIGAFKEAINDPAIKEKVTEVGLAWSGVLEAVKRLVTSDAWKSVVEAVTFVGLTTLKTILDVISGIIDGIRVGIEKVDENGQLKEFKEAWDEVTTAVSELFQSEGFQYLIGVAFSVVLGAITTALELISTFATSFKSALDELKQNGTLDKLEGAFSSLWDAIKRISESEIVKELLEGGLVHALEQVSTFIDAIAQALGLIASIINLDLPGAFKHLVLFIMDISELIFKALLVPLETIGNGIVELLNKIPGVNIPTSNFMETWQKQHDATRAWLEDWLDSLGQTSAEKGAEAGKEYATNFGDEAKGIEVDVGSDFSAAKEGHGTFIDEVKGTSVDVPVGANTTTAETKTNLYKKTLATTVTVPVTANTTSAFQQANKFKDEAKKTVTTPITADTSSATKIATAFANEVKKTLTAPITAEVTNGAAVKTSLETLLGTLSLNGSFSKENKKTIKGALNTALSSLGLNGSFSNKDKTSIKSDVASYLQELELNGYFSKEVKTKIWCDLRDFFSDIPMKGYVEEIITPTYVNPFGGGDVTYRPNAGKATGGIIGAASGRIVDSAQFFMARENGIPEYVGRFGSHSAVANNYQIVTGIAQGVSAAMASQNELLREQNMLLTQIATQGSNVNVSSILGAVNRTNKRTGQPVVTMG